MGAYKAVFVQYDGVHIYLGGSTGDAHRAFAEAAASIIRCHSPQCNAHVETFDGGAQVLLSQVHAEAVSVITAGIERAAREYGVTCELQIQAYPTTDAYLLLLEENKRLQAELAEAERDRNRLREALPLEFRAGRWAHVDDDHDSDAVVTYASTPSPETGHVGWVWWARGKMGEASSLREAKRMAMDKLRGARRGTGGEDVGEG
jgi:hypothetical protein